ncbi:CIC11C00000001084 [Sungouiella intermedia]|uniref:CIC11C00000001084 n=1 Tax=Sungouiella intermedia TaxID=45354 RepID=A0A1L0BWQ9_9ASCO|nr:CIC11C00000001084 [[Candida] intermedia]
MSEELYIPIPHYPPFKLRSSLIDKDPVIWVHLLEGYLDLCKLLLSGDVVLNVKSAQQLQLFIKVFLSETAQETTQIFSLGAINPDIKKNTTLLRAYVFQVIRSYSAVKLALNGESLWNFVLIYVEHNVSTVRGLIDGSLKSPLNDNKKSGKILLIPLLRKHLESLISLGKMPDDHLKYFASLLGQHTLTLKVQKVLVTSSHSKVLAKDKYKGNGSNSLQFAEAFVNEDWIEMLERLYAGGKSIYAQTVKNWMVVSVLSLSTAKLAKVVSTLGINSAESMILAPLLSALILSDAYKQLNPGLEARLPFLSNIAFAGAVEPVNEADVEFLVGMFPSLTPTKAATILRMNGCDAEKVTHLLLEDPLLINTIPEELETKKAPKPIKASELERGIERFKLRDNETTQSVSKQQPKSSETDIKNKTLSAALRLLYESDEDERDDTYDDQEHTSGMAFLEYDRKPKNKDKARVAVLDEDTEDAQDTESASSPAPPEVSNIELNLFDVLKTNGETAFEKTSRKLKVRQDMKLATEWTDEQIEGWYRMIKKSPRRFRLLEEQYVFHFSNRKTLATTSNASKASQTPGGNNPDRKKVNARNEKQKSSRANHNRKSGHNKKAKAELAGLRE